MIERYRDAPTLTPYESWIEEALARLGRDRQIGFGVMGPIPWSSLENYLDRRGVSDPLLRLRIERILIELDVYETRRDDG